MKFKKITAGFQADSLAFAEDLICNIFFSFGLKGVVCDVPIPEPDEGFGTHTLPLPEENAIIGYIPDMDSADLTIEKIKKELAGLSAMGIRVFPRIRTVDEANWAHAWKAYFNVTRITDRIVIKPEWKPYAPAPGEIVVHIDPGMAFGTGTHPTTAMCLAFLETVITPKDALLDVGCGSGILMIAGALLGAQKITGIDTDPAAVEITRDNMKKNQAWSSDIRLITGTLDQAAKDKYQVITANIIAQVIVDILGDIRARLAPGGTALLSGIILEREPDVLAALDTNELVMVKRAQQQEWVALAVQHG
jgi:ribosomal protein L11 methyltransferase